MGTSVESQSVFERIQKLRAAGDIEGWARLLMESGLAKEECQALHLTGDEWRAYKTFKDGLTREERGAHKEKIAKRRRALRMEQRQRDAYEHLCELREQGETYWVAVFARKTRGYYQEVIAGDGLMPGVPRFELTAEEAEAIRLQKEREDARSNDDDEVVLDAYEWRRVRARVYVSTNWKWYIEKQGRREWVVYYDGELWRKWCGRRNRFVECLTFESLLEAQAAIEAKEDKGFAY